MKTKLLLSSQNSIRSFVSPLLRRLLIILALCPVPCVLHQALAQVPQGFNYQAIARDGSGNPIAGATINVKLSILTDTSGFRATGGGVYLWEEEHLNVLTNAFGLFNIVLGDPEATQVGGTATSFNQINWSLSDLYIGTKIANPTTYKVLGAAKLWSVPYALRAKDSDQWLVNGTDIYRLTGKVGIGTSTPLVPLSVYSPGTNTTIHIGGTTAGLTYLSAGTSANTNGYSYLQSVKTAGTAYGDLIINNGGGNVGIGTATPTRKLDVRGVIKGVTLTGAAATAGQFQSYTEGGAPGQRSVYSFYPTFEATPGGYTPRRAADILSGFNGGNWGTEYLSFNVGSNASANDVENLTSEKMRITSNGYVGIGTTTAYAKLNVSDNANTSITYPLYIQNASGDWSATEKGVGLKFGRAYPTSGHDYGTIQGTIASGDGAQGRLQFIGGPGSVPHMTINASGNVGIGTISPGSKLDVNGGITSSGLTIRNSGLQSGLMIYKSDNPTDQKGTELLSLVDGSFIGRFVNDAYTQAESWFSVARNTSTYTVKNVTFPSGNVGIGTTAPSSKVVIQPSSTWDDNVPLFEVKNKYGTPVLAVYNNGVRILVAHDAAKGVTKGGFAIGGFDNTKAVGETVNLMTVAPDSIRFNIDNDNTKGITKGGFAIGSFDVTKGINVNPKEFMNMTPLGSTTGQFNTFLGYQAGSKNKTGYENTFIGYLAGYNTTGATYNVAVGKEAASQTSLLTGSGVPTQSVFIGTGAGKNGGGTCNVMLGNYAGENNKGGFNVFLGQSETLDNKLIIAGNWGNCKLITGDFASSYVVIAGADPNSKTFFVNGTAGGWSAWTNVSDVRFKKDIVTIPDAMNKIRQMRGVNFYWKDSLAFENDKQIGFIAQEVEKILPEVVSKDEKSGRLFLEYAPITALLVEAMKDQQKQIEVQQMQIESAKEENQLLKSQLQLLQEKMDRIEAMLLKGGVK